MCPRSVGEEEAGRQGSNKRRGEEKIGMYNALLTSPVELLIRLYSLVSGEEWPEEKAGRGGPVMKTVIIHLFGSGKDDTKLI